jgi:uncharacterized membrane protein
MPLELLGQKTILLVLIIVVVTMLYVWIQATLGCALAEHNGEERDPEPADLPELERPQPRF